MDHIIVILLLLNPLLVLANAEAALETDGPSVKEGPPGDTTCTMAAESSNEHARIKAATNQLNKREDLNEESILMSSNPEVWVNTLSPSITSISLLGQLVLVTSREDFSLVEKAPVNGFQYIRQPSSFRACLLQVCNDAYKAYNTADDSMDQIHTISSQIPGIVNEALQLIVKGTHEERVALVPNSLKKIETRINKCKEQASKTENEFHNVMNLINELLEVSQAKKKAQDDDIHKAKQERRSKKIQHESISQDKEKSEEDLEKLKKLVGDARDQYNKAINDLPGSTSIFVLEVVKSFSGGLSAVLPFFNGRLNLASAALHFASIFSTETPKSKVPEDIAMITQPVHAILCLLKTMITPDQQKKYIDWAAIRKREDGPQFIEAQLESYTSKVTKDPSNKYSIKYSELLSKGIALCKTIHQTGQSMSIENITEEELLANAEELCVKSQELKTAVAMATGSNPTEPKQPSVDKKMSQFSATEAETAAFQDKARYKVEETKQNMQRREEQYEKISNELREHNREQRKLIEEMSQIDLETIDFEEIKETLKKGMNALAQVRTQWAKLVDFFQAVSNVVNNQLHMMLTDFVGTARTAQENELAISAVLQDMLYAQAREGIQAAHIVYYFSSIYEEVSSKHLMQNVVKLGELVTLDPDTNQHEIKEAQRQLMIDCKLAQEGMEKVIVEKAADFKQRIRARITKVETTMMAVLPPDTEEEKLKRQKAVKEAMDFDEEDW